MPPSTAANRNKFLRGDATWQTPTNTTYAAVTTAANGLMTKEDKIKLNGITPGATSYAVATTSADGLMSSADKTKLDGVETGANKTVVDTAMSTTSTNPVQNKVVDAAIKAVETRVTTILDGADTAFDTFKEIGDWIGTHETEFEALQDLSANKVDKVEGKGLSTNDYTTAEKNKLAGIASGAEVNQNAFSNVKVGSTTAAAGAKTDTLEIAGSGSVTVSASGKKITVSGTNTTYAAATTGANGLMSSADKTKLDGITEGATTYAFTNGAKTLAWNTTSTIATVGGVDITVKMPANPDTNTTYAVTTTAAAGLAPKLSGGTTSYLRGDGTWQVPTNTTYAAVTTAANGLMTKEDKIKLNGVATGAEVNQNAFSNVVIGTTTAAAGAKTDTLTVKASGAASVSLNGKELTIGATDTTYAAATGSALGLVKTGSNITNSSGTISLTKANVTAALGYTPPTTDTNTTYAAVTTAANGLMSKDDKTKLDGVATGAEVNQNAFSNIIVGTTTAAAASATDDFTVKATGAATVSLSGKELTINSTDTTYAAATGSALGLVKTGSNITNSSGTISITKANVTAALGYTPPSTDTNTTYAAVTTAANGLMTKEDKIKLNGVAENANNYVHPTATSKASGLYKVTVDGTGHVTAATAVAKADITGLGIPAQDTTYAAATGSALGLVKIGSNISNSSGTISLTKANVTAALGYTPPTTDTNTTYASLKNPNALTIGNKSYDGSEAIDGGIGVYYKTGTGTAAVTTSPYTFAKWDCTDERVTELYDGLMMLYKVPVAGNGTYGTCFQVNSLGYHPVVSVVNTMVGTRYGVNATVLLVYDSTVSANVYNNSASAAAISGVWRVVNDYDSGNTNTVPSVQCETAAATAAKAGTCTNYTLTANTYVFVNFRYANTSKTAITLNINSKGAKPIYINGAASSTSNYTLPAGTYIAYYNGTNFYFRTDGLLPGNYGGTAMKLDTATTLGKGLVPTLTGSTSVYLNGNGAWTTPTNTTYGAATTAALGLVKIGSNITNSSGTISLAKANVTAALGYTPPTTNTTYAAVTTAANGLMTAADKIKLNTLLDLVTTDKSAGSTDLIYGLILETE